MFSSLPITSETAANQVTTLRPDPCMNVPAVG